MWTRLQSKAIGRITRYWKQRVGDPTLRLHTAARERNGAVELDLEVHGEDNVLASLTYHIRWDGTTSYTALAWPPGNTA